LPKLTPNQLALEIGAQAEKARGEINSVKMQISSKQREIRMLQLTSEEVSTLPSDTNVYEGVGKM
jgi:prefoldin subunit 1